MVARSVLAPDRPSMNAVQTIIFLLHLLSAIAAIGGWFALLVLLSHMRQRPQTAPTLLPVVARIAAFPRHGGLSLLVTGILLVALKDWALFKQPWIAISLVLLLGSIAAGFIVLLPRMKSLGGQLARSAPAEQVAAGIQSVRQLGVAITLVSVVILVLMVVRPGG